MRLIISAGLSLAVLLTVASTAGAATPYRALLGSTYPFTVEATIPDGWQVQAGGGQGDVAFQPQNATANDNDVYLEACGTETTAPIYSDPTGATAVDREVKWRRARTPNITTSMLANHAIEVTYPADTPSFVVPVIGGFCISVEPTNDAAVAPARALAGSIRAFLGKTDAPVQASDAAGKVLARRGMDRVARAPIQVDWSASQCDAADIGVDDNPFWNGRCPAIGIAYMYHRGHLRMTRGRFYAQTTRPHSNEELFPAALQEGLLIVKGRAWTRQRPTACWKAMPLRQAHARRKAFLAAFSFTSNEYRLTVGAPGPRAASGERYVNWTSFATTNAWLRLAADGSPKRLSRTMLGPPPYLPWAGLSEVRARISQSPALIRPPKRAHVCPAPR